MDVEWQITCKSCGSSNIEHDWKDGESLPGKYCLDCGNSKAFSYSPPDGYVVCANCNGAGSWDFDFWWEDCEICEGTGFLAAAQDGGGEGDAE